MFQAVANIFKVPELKRKIFITLSLLVVYRAGCFIPTPGVNTVALSQFFTDFAEREGQTLFGILDLFTGGAFEQLSIFALGIMPYISASIIMQLLQNVVPFLEKLAKEGKAGFEKINQYTRGLTLALCLVQGLFLSFWLSNPDSFPGYNVVPNPGLLFTFTTIVTLTCGTIFVMWLGEQIQERGIGNGISIIITVSIISRIPSAVGHLWHLWSPLRPENQQVQTPIVIALVAIWFFLVGAVVLFTQAQRRIPIQYGRRMVGRKMYGGQSTYLPIKVDMAGVIAIIFAMAVLSFPATITMFLPEGIGIINFIQSIVQQRGLWYNFIMVGLLFFFMYFYTAMVFHPLEIANNLKRYGGFIPGVRPGRPTANYIDYVATRIVFLGAIYISVIAIFPDIMMERFELPSYQLASLFGGTTLLIMVAVVLDTMKQVEGQLLTRHYDGFIKGSPLKGRR